MTIRPPAAGHSVLLGLATTILLPWAAFVGAGEAESSEPERVLRSVVVEEEAEEASRSEDSGSYTVPASTSAFKLPLTLRETPQTVTVIPQQVIRDFGLRDARDILEFTPGVHVQAERNTEAYYFQARGFEMQTQFDGVPAPNGVGGRGTGSPDAAFLDRVEVLHGASGLLTGAGAPGGTVNLVRKTPGREFASSVEAGFDSFGGYRFVGDIGGPLGESGIGGRLVALHQELDLFVDEAKGKQTELYGVFSLPLGARTKFVLGGNYGRLHDANFGAHYGNPTNPDGSLRDLPRSLNLGAGWAWQKETRTGLFLRGEHLFGNGWRVIGMLSRDTTDFGALEGVPGSEITDDIYLYAQEEGWQNKSTALDLYLDGPVSLFGRTHLVMFGVNGARRRELQDDYRFGLEPLTIIDPATWDPDQAPDPDSIDWDATNWGNGDRKQYGAFAAARIELADTLHAILGSRVSWARAAWEGTNYNDEGGKLTPYAGVTWDFSKSVSAYASYSEIFQPQDLGTIDANGDALAPVVGENLETGFKLELADGAFNASLGVFRLDQTNLAEPDLQGELQDVCGPLPPLPECYKASGLVRSQGYEISVSGRIGAGWQVNGGYAYLSMKHKTSPDESIGWDPATPRHMLVAALSWTSPDDRWNGGVSLRHQSKSYTKGTVDWDFDEDGDFETIPYRIQQDGYTLAGLYGRFSPSKRLSVHLAVDNLFDKKYLSGISWPVHGQVYGEPRRLSLMVRTGF